MLYDLDLTFTGPNLFVANAFISCIMLNSSELACYNSVLGCTDETAFNYDPNATEDDGSCIPVIFGCISHSAFNNNPNANVDDF